MANPGTANPQCFAKAGKMEPNHLFNGFGPLQPAVAMLWWLPELLLSAHHYTSRRQLPGWVVENVPRLFNKLAVVVVPNKSQLHRWQPWCCPLSWVSVASLPPSGLIFQRRYQRLVSKIAEGEGRGAEWGAGWWDRHAACAISETQHSHIYERMRGCLTKSRLPPAVSGQ